MIKKELKYFGKFFKWILRATIYLFILFFIIMAIMGILSAFI